MFVNVYSLYKWNDKQFITVIFAIYQNTNLNTVLHMLIHLKYSVLKIGFQLNYISSEMFNQPDIMYGINHFFYNIQ